MDTLHRSTPCFLNVSQSPTTTVILVPTHCLTQGLGTMLSFLVTLPRQSQVCLLSCIFFFSLVPLLKPRLCTGIFLGTLCRDLVYFFSPIFAPSHCLLPTFSLSHLPSLYSSLSLPVLLSPDSELIEDKKCVCSWCLQHTVKGSDTE